MSDEKKDAAGKSFNDDELQDIMSEIENLEKEFVEDSAPAAIASEVIAEIDAEATAEEVSEEATTEEIIDEIAEEVTTEEVCVDNAAVEAELAEIAEIEVEAVAPAEDNVVAISESSPDKTMSASNTSMDFSGSGNMDFNLSFSVDGNVAHLNIDKESGCTLKLAEVEISISGDGCVVSMGGGVQFTVPFNTSNVDKKAA